MVILSCIALLIAQIASSFLSWHGTPTDWLGEPLHFWTFELWRLNLGSFSSLLVLVCFCFAGVRSIAECLTLRSGYWPVPSRSQSRS